MPLLLCIRAACEYCVAAQCWCCCDRSLGGRRAAGCDCGAVACAAQGSALAVAGSRRRPA
eukprot:5352294-Alexandrium_andersonii.AAC.1